ncbi:MAG: hypothetical protein ACI828_001817, partial [Flavobacteriales bacterium]
MKAILHKISAALMAIVLVFTTMSFSVSMHYCGDTLVNYSFTHAVDGCVMHSMATSDATGCDEVLSKKSCCSDEQWVFEGQDEVKVSWDSFSLEQPSIFEVNNFSYLNLSFGG